MAGVPPGRAEGGSRTAHDKGGQRRARLLALLAPIGLLCAAVTVAPVGPAAAGGGSGTNAIQIWGLQSENTNSNYVPVAPDRALLDAFHFSYITAHPVAYQGEVAAMKAINPNLKIFAYENSVFAQNWQGTAYPDSWYLRDSNGNKVINPASGNFLMNPTQSGWIQDRISNCQQLIAQSGYDGCYLDMLGLASLRKGFVSAHPIDPRTNLPWALNDWITVTATLAGQVTTAVAPKMVVGNGINSGSLYYSKRTPTKPLLDAMDGGIAEAWLRGSTISVTTYHEGNSWVQDVKVVGAAESASKPLLGLVKIGVSATSNQLASWQQYGLATLLMGTQGRSAFFFSPNITTSRTSWYPIYNVIIGGPTGAMAPIAGNPVSVYQRTFQYGTVLVNNTTSATTLSLKGGPYYDVNGNLVTTTPLSLPANTGLILRTQLTPIASVTSGPSSPTTASSATISFTSDTAGSTFTCAVDGAAAQPCTSPLSLSGLALGPHLVSVQPTGPTGIQGSAVPYAWDVTDGAKPVASFTSTPANGSGSSASLAFTSTEPASSFTCSLDGASPTLCTSPDTLSGLTTGVQHTLTVTVTDPYGVAGTPATFTWTA
jgi:hypothetical protein